VDTRSNKKRPWNNPRPKLGTQLICKALLGCDASVGIGIFLRICLKACWVPHDIRDQVVDYVQHWRKRTDLGVAHFIVWLAIGSSKFFEWKRRYGRVNEHDALIPRS
jgi:hypothetical protein